MCISKMEMIDERHDVATEVHEHENSCRLADKHFHFKVSQPTRFSVALPQTNNGKPFSLPHKPHHQSLNVMYSNILIFNGWIM